MDMIDFLNNIPENSLLVHLFLTDAMMLKIALFYFRYGELRLTHHAHRSATDDIRRCRFERWKTSATFLSKPGQKIKM